MKFALRQLLKNPGFTLAALLTLGVAIAVNATVFSVLRTILYRPVSPVHPEEVVGIFSNRPTARGDDFRQFSHAEFQALRGDTDVFRDMTALHATVVGAGEGAETRRALAAIVPENFFSFHGAALAQGRPFTPEECRPGATAPVLIASHACWQRMGAPANFVGSTLRISGRAFTVVGIAPDQFSGINALLVPDFWFPLGVFGLLSGGLDTELPPEADLASPRIFALSVSTRLAPGVSLEAARSRLPALATRVASLAPPVGEESTSPRQLVLAPQARFGISDSPDQDEVSAGLAALLQGMALLVLVVASLNLANLFLARGVARRREIALRMAVGASRGRVIRQLLTESALLALGGGALGLALGTLGFHAVITSLVHSVATSFSYAPAFDARPDTWTAAAVAGCCVVATLVFGVGPAINLSRRNLAHDMRADAAAGDAGRGGWRGLLSPRNLLVAGQLALSLALVFAATQFVRGAMAVVTRSPGFRTDRSVVAEVDYALARVPRDQTIARFGELRRRVEAMPGVESAAWATLVPFADHDSSRRAVGLGPSAMPAEPGKTPGSYGMFTAVDPGYFALMGITLVAGRDFTPAEAAPNPAARAVIVDEKLARRLFTDGVAVGRRLRLGTDTDAPECEIVGVVRSPWHNVLRKEPPARLYVPLASDPSSSASLHVRLAAGGREAMTGFFGPLRRELTAADPSALVVRISMLEDFRERSSSLWLVRSTAGLFGIFAGVALLLAAVGVYGVAAYLVSRRTREIGIRMALGATVRHVLGLILGQGALQAALAVVVGVGLALGLTRLLGSQLSVLPPADVWTLGACALFLFSVAVLAALPPARRAARVQPTEALRSE